MHFALIGGSGQQDHRSLNVSLSDPTYCISNSVISYCSSLENLEGAALMTRV